MPNPTCPHCKDRFIALDALPFAGGLAILLSCGCIVWQPRSRFTGNDEPTSSVSDLVAALFTMALPLI